MPRSPFPPVTPALVLVALLAGVVACSGSDAEPPPAAVPGASTLAVEIVQNRSDVAPRRVQVKVRQGDGPVVELRRLELVASGFAAAERDLDTRSRPGGAVDLPVPVGEVHCDQEPGEVVVRLAVGPDAQPVELVAAQPRPILAFLHERECAAAALLALVPLSLGEQWQQGRTPEGPAAQGVLRVGPVAAGHTVEVVDLDDTTLFRTTSAAALPLPLAAGAAADVPMAVAAARCDPHAVAEDKQGYLFGVLVRLDGAEPLRVVVRPTDTARDVMQDALLDRCGLR